MAKKPDEVKAVVCLIDLLEPFEPITRARLVGTANEFLLKRYMETDDGKKEDAEAKAT